MAKNPNCPCPNKGCDLHGDCAACVREHHGRTMYCKLPGWRRKINDWLCKILPGAR
jgi:hypothetical protein